MYVQYQYLTNSLVLIKSTVSLISQPAGICQAEGSHLPIIIIVYYSRAVQRPSDVALFVGGALLV